MMVLSISFLYAKDSALRTKWHDAKTKAKEQYKKLQDKATDEQKASLNPQQVSTIYLLLAAT